MTFRKLLDGYRWIYSWWLSNIMLQQRKHTYREGVALIWSRTIQNALLGYNPVSSIIISARIQIQSGILTVIQVYVSNLAHSEEDTDDFYNQLIQSTIDNTFKKDVLIVMGDLNAKVGANFTQWNQVIGQHGHGKANSWGEKLLNFCAANYLGITSTLFKQSKENRQWTWESPDQKTHTKI